MNKDRPHESIYMKPKTRQKQTNGERIKNGGCQGWGNDLAGKSRLQFPEHTWWLPIPVSEDRAPSSGLSGYCMYTVHRQNTHTCKIKLYFLKNIIFKKGKRDKGFL